MSAFEYVVIEVWSVRENMHGTDARWLDYSRCTAAEARGFLNDENAQKFRAKHWVTGELLDSDQLRVMAREPGRRYEYDTPKGVVVWEYEREVLAESLLNALLSSDKDAWSGYLDVVDTFKLVAPPHLLKVWDDAQED